MGFFKQLKELKDLVAAAPEMIQQAEQLGVSAGAMQAAHQAQMNAATAAAAAMPAPEGDPDFEPISGVSLELYAEISRGLASVGYDQTKAAEIAASKGVDGDDWDAALNGWNDRMRSNPAVAQRFNALYAGRT